MPSSPHEKLRALEDILRKKEQEKREAEQKAEQTTKELNTLKAALRAEQEQALLEEELALRDQDVRDQDNEDETSSETQESERARMQQNIEDFIEDVPRTQQLGGALYAVQERMKTGGMSLYEMTQTVDTLAQLRQETALTQNQYNILNEFEDQLRQRQALPEYSDQQLYAQQANQSLDDIKEQLGVRVGDSLYDSSDFQL